MAKERGVETYLVNWNIIVSEAYKNNYDGILEKTPLKRLKQKASWADMVVFDMTRTNEKNQRDGLFVHQLGYHWYGYR